MDEEKEWDFDDANVHLDALSDSGEESEEHDSEDVCFYSDEDDNDDVDNIGEMIENPPPPFEFLSDDDEKTDDMLIGKRKREGNRGEKAK